ncbi:MAG: lectin-like protein, partial [Minicystis sp.]
MYDNPADSRFVFMPNGMHDVFGDLNFNPYAKPDSKLSQRIRNIPALDTRYRAAVLHVLYDLWDTDFLHARIDQVTAAFDSDLNSDPRTLADIASYKANVADTHLAVDLRKAKVLASASATCGNGTLEGFEECDDHNLVVGDGCNAVCMKEYCGDGTVQPSLGEVCDGAGCKPDCKGFAVCGNAIKDPGEQCDDGNLAALDGCSSNCLLEDCTVLTNLGKSYAFCTDLRPAYDARAICQSAGGTLAVPQDDAENTWMITSAFNVLGEAYWIGIDDEGQDGIWKKPNGSVAQFLPWGANEPNGGAVQNCGIISFVLSGGWNDKACTDTNGYICALP